MISRLIVDRFIIFAHLSLYLLSIHRMTLLYSGWAEDHFINRFIHQKKATFSWDLGETLPVSRDIGQVRADYVSVESMHKVNLHRVAGVNLPACHHDEVRLQYCL
jgi:hypothetical protein